MTSARIILSADRLSLSITTIQPGDDGIYTVVISNAAGSITVQLSIAHQGKQHRPSTVLAQSQLHAVKCPCVIRHYHSTKYVLGY